MQELVQITHSIGVHIIDLALTNAFKFYWYRDLLKRRLPIVFLLGSLTDDQERKSVCPECCKICPHMKRVSSSSDKCSFSVLPLNF